MKVFRACKTVGGRKAVSGHKRWSGGRVLAALLAGYPRTYVHVVTNTHLHSLKLHTHFHPRLPLFVSMHTSQSAAPLIIEMPYKR